jgi:hypothetical protein
VKYANDIVVVLVVVIAINAAASVMTTFGQYFVTSVNVLYVPIVQIPVIITLLLYNLWRGVLYCMDYREKETQRIC